MGENLIYNSKFIFVFGSNEAGIHGAGAAKWAKDYLGAEPGVGFGITGNAFALPTKDHTIQTLPLSSIKEYLRKFVDYAKTQPSVAFNLTPIGCGLAGLQKKQILTLLNELDYEGHPLPQNVLFDSRWLGFNGG